MNLFPLIIAFAEGEAEASPTIALLAQLAPLVLIFGFMYLILIRPQRKREKKTREMINEAVVGDKVTTIGGISGTIVNIKDDEVTIETGIERAKINIKKWGIKEVDKLMQS